MSQDVDLTRESPTTERAPTATESSSGQPASARPVQLRQALRGMSYEEQLAALSPSDAPVQQRGEGDTGGDVHAAAAHGISGGGQALPHAEAIQRSFGPYDVSQVTAHLDAAAAEGAGAMGAEAYATGDHVAFAGAPSLHTAAHEAAHVVQQQRGVQLKGGVGEVGDVYERHADRVADAVVAGESAAPILAELAGPASGSAGAVQRRAVQRKETGGPGKGDDAVDPRVKAIGEELAPFRMSSWFWALHPETTTALMEAAVALRDALTRLPTDQPDEGAQTDRATLEEAYQELKSKAELELAAGEAALKEIRFLVDIRIKEVLEAQRAGEAMTPPSFGPLWESPRLGEPSLGESSPYDAELKPILMLYSDNPVAHGALADASETRAPFQEAWQGSDGWASRHWRAHRVPDRALEAKLSAVDAWSEQPWVGAIPHYKGLQDKASEALRTLKGHYEAAAGPIELGKVNGGEDMSQAIAEAEKAATKAEGDFIPEANDARETVEKLGEHLSAHAAGVRADKDAATGADPVEAEALWQTSRFGDETQDKDARVYDFVRRFSTDEGYKVTDERLLLFLYNRTPSLQAPFDRSRAEDDGREVKRWDAQSAPLLEEAPKLADEARALEWLRRYRPEAAEDHTSLSLARFAGALEFAYQRLSAAIARGRPYVAAISGDLITIRNNEPLYAREKEKLEALRSAPTLDEVLTGLRGTLSGLNLDKTNAASVREAVAVAVDEALKNPALLGALKEVPELKAAQTRLELDDTKLGEVIMDLFVTHATLRTGLLNAFMAGDKDGKRLEEGGAVLDALSPVPALVEALKKNQTVGREGISERLDLIRDFVKRWGEAEVGGVLKETRTDAAFIAATKSFLVAADDGAHRHQVGKVAPAATSYPTFDTASLAVVHEMLLTGKPIAFEPPEADAASGEAKGGGFVYEDGTDLPAERQLLLATNLSPEEQTAARLPGLIRSTHSLHLALEGERYIFWTRKDIFDRKPAEARAEDTPPTFDPALAARHAAFLSDCAPKESIRALVERVGPDLAAPFKDLLAFSPVLRPPVEAGLETEMSAGDASASVFPSTEVTDTTDTTDASEGKGRSSAIPDAKGSAPDDFYHNHRAYFGDKWFDPRAEPQQTLVTAIAALTATDPTAYPTIASALREAYAAAETLWDKAGPCIKEDKRYNVIDPRVTVQGERLPNARMQLIHTFMASRGVDLVTWLENHLHDTGGFAARLTGDLLTVFGVSQHDFSPVEAALGETLGLKVRVEANGSYDSRVHGFDINTLSDGETREPGGTGTALKDHPLLGDANFIPEGVPVNAGFDSYAALRIAENLYDYLHGSAASKQKQRNKDADLDALKQDANVSFGAAMLWAPMPDLLAVLASKPKPASSLVAAVVTLAAGERAAADNAAMARYGKGLDAIIDSSPLKDKFAKDRSRNMEGPERAVRMVLGQMIDAESELNRIADYIARLTPEQREAIKEDAPLRADLEKYADQRWTRLSPAYRDRRAEFTRLLDGDTSAAALFENIKKNDGVVYDDYEGVKADVLTHIELIKSTLRAKYPDALKPAGTGKQAEHKAAFEAELRVELSALANADWASVNKNTRSFLSEEQIAELRGIILGGGVGYGAEKILAEWRKTSWWQSYDRKGLAATVAAMDAETVKKIGKDPEIRVAIHKVLPAEDAAECLRILEGDGHLLLPKKAYSLFGFKWGDRVDKAALLERARNLPYADWLALRADAATVLDMLVSLDEAGRKSLRTLLELDSEGVGVKAGFDADSVALELGRKKGDAKDDAKDDTKKEDPAALAKARFLRSQQKAKLLHAAETSKKAQDMSALLTALQANYNLSDEELSLKPDGESGGTVRRQLAKDEELLKAAEDAFAGLWGVYCEVWTAALEKEKDPAPALVTYHTRGVYEREDGDTKHPKSLGPFKLTGANAQGIASALTGASPRTFLLEFTNMPKVLTPELKAWKEAPAEEKLRAAQRVRRVQYSYSDELKRALEATTHTGADSRGVVKAAFDAKVLATLGTAPFDDAATSAKHRGVIDGLLAELAGLDAAEVEGLWHATDFEAAYKTSKAREKAEEASGNALAWGKGDTQDSAILHASQQGQIANEASAKEGVIDKEALGHIDQMGKTVDEQVAAIDARAKRVKEYIVATGKFAVSTTANLFLPGSGWLVKLTTAIGQTALEGAAGAWKGGQGWNGFVKAMTEQAIGAVGGELLGVLGQGLSANLPMGTLLKVSEWHPFLADKALLNTGIQASIQAGLDQFQKDLGAGILKSASADDLAKLQAALERGLGAYAQQSWSNMWGSLKEVFTDGKADLALSLLDTMGGAFSAAAKKHLSDETLKQLGYEKPKDDDALVKAFDADGDGRIKDELATLHATSEGGRLLDAAFEALKSVPQDILKAVPALDAAAFWWTPELRALVVDPEYKDGKLLKGEELQRKFVNSHWNKLKKSLVDGTLELGATAFKTYAAVQGDPHQFWHEVVKGTGELAKTPSKKFEAFTKDLHSGKLIWDAIEAGAKTTSEAFAKAWMKYKLVSDIMELDADNAGLLDALGSEDAAERDTASAFIQLRQADDDLTTTLAEYRARIEKMTEVAAPPAVERTLFGMSVVPQTLAVFKGEVDARAQQLSQKTQEDQAKARAAIARYLAQKKGGADLFADSGAKSLLLEALDRWQTTSVGELDAKKFEKDAVKKGADALKPKEPPKPKGEDAYDWLMRHGAEARALMQQYVQERLEEAARGSLKALSV